jgi:hypothetical protein
MKMINWSVSGPNYERLIKTLKRLNESQFYLETASQDAENKKIRPLKLFSFEEDGNMLVLWIPIESMKLFEKMNYLNLEARKTMNVKMGLAKSIQLFSSGFSHAPTQRMLVSELRDITQRKSRVTVFVHAVETALKELERVGVLKDTWVKKEVGSWYCGWTLVLTNEKEPPQLIGVENDM